LWRVTSLPVRESYDFGDHGPMYMKKEDRREPLKNNALKINEKDNVVIATQPVKKGEPVVVNGKRLFEAAEDVDAGHKIALIEIAEGESIFRYGEPIVEATRKIRPGEWTHVHNTRPIPGDLEG
jgi:hypothetical protein